MLEGVELDHKSLLFMYNNDKIITMMDQESFIEESYPISLLPPKSIQLLDEGMIFKVSMYNGKVVQITLGDGDHIYTVTDTAGAPR